MKKASRISHVTSSLLDKTQVIAEESHQNKFYSEEFSNTLVYGYVGL